MSAIIMLVGAVALAALLVSGRHRLGVRMTKFIGTALSASTLASIAFVPAASAVAPQGPLYITNTVLSAPVGTAIKITATGGSGTGVVTFKATGTGCVITAAKSTVGSTAIGHCVVTATKAASGPFSAIDSAPVTFSFTGSAQATLTISNKSLSALVSKTITLTTAGGSGTGAVSYTVSGTSCAVKGAVLSATAYTTCIVTATKASAGAYLSATSVSVSFTFLPTTFQIVNPVHAGTVGTPLTVSALGGTAVGSTSFSVTGTGCSINSSTGVLSATQATTCVVSAFVMSGSKKLATATPVSFGFTVENPTVAHPDVATLTSISGKVGNQIDDTANGRTYFINQYYNSHDHWYVNYIPAGATVGITWHVNGSNGLPLVGANVTLLSNLPYTCSQGVTWTTSGLNVYPGCNGGQTGTISGTTDVNGNVTFTVTNNNLVGGSAPTNMTTAAGVDGNEASTFPWTAMLLQVNSDIFTGNPATQVNQATDRVDLIVIPATGNGSSVDKPTVANPDVAALTGTTGTTGNRIDDTSNGRTYFINQYYNSHDHWYGNYINTGAAITMKWHVTGYNGKPFVNAPVTLHANLGYACATGVTWSAASLNVYPGCNAGAEGLLTGTTDALGNVTFNLTNTNTDVGTAPTDTTTTAGLEANEGPFSWTNMMLQVGNDIYSGNPLTQVNQGTDRVDFVVIPNAPTAPQTTPTYSNPDVATLTSISGAVNSTPIDFTTQGDQWFIRAYYSPSDRWNFTYITAGSSVTETWHVVGFDGSPLANTTVTLLTGFAGNDANWTATGIDANGHVTGTTDSNGDVSFTITNTDTTPSTTPSDTTNGWTALGAEGTNPFTRMALVIGTPIDNAGLDKDSGAIGSSTDVINAGAAYIKSVNQATDLVDFIVIPSGGSTPPPPPTGPTHAQPDVATMTGVSGTVNSTPIDFTSNGDQWFINSYYAATDHWNFTYVTAGSTFTETWHVVGYDGNALANTTVTLLTTFGGANPANWSSSSGDASGYITGTTDASGNVTFTITNTNSSASAVDNTSDGWTALGAEGANPWTRMALVIGTPAEHGGLPASNGAVGSTTDVITAGGSYVQSVNQATDLVDIIVIPA